MSKIQSRRGQRSRIRLQVHLWSRDDRNASFAIERGFDYLEHNRIRFHRVERRILDRLKLDAAEEKSGHGRVDPRQNRKALRKPDVDLDHAKSTALVL